MSTILDLIPSLLYLLLLLQSPTVGIVLLRIFLLVHWVSQQFALLSVIMVVNSVLGRKQEQQIMQHLDAQDVAIVKILERQGRFT